MKNKRATKKQTLYRCYIDEGVKKSADVVGSSLFDLIGRKEPDQTKSLGYVLARSAPAMRYFLELVYSKIPDAEKVGVVKDLMKEDYSVDCELMLQSDSGSRDRADIVVRFPQSQYAIIVEAKSITVNASSKAAYFQGQSYANRLQIKQKTVVSLTNNRELGNCIQWSEIVDVFDMIVRRIKYSDVSLEGDYLNYLLKIKGLMNYYDIEVLSIPVGRTMEGVKQVGIYECPSTVAPYKSRGEHKPLFIAFRGKKGSVKKLYKVDMLLNIPLAGSSYLSQRETLSSEVVERIEGYKQIVNYPTDANGLKWVFVLDDEHSIDLPHEVIYKRNNSFVETLRPLSDYFSAPNADGVVVFS